MIEVGATFGDGKENKSTSVITLNSVGVSECARYARHLNHQLAKAAAAAAQETVVSSAATSAAAARQLTTEGPACALQLQACSGSRCND